MHGAGGGRPLTTGAGWSKTVKRYPYLRYYSEDDMDRYYHDVFQMKKDKERERKRELKRRLEALRTRNKP